METIASAQRACMRVCDAMARQHVHIDSCRAPRVLGTPHLHLSHPEAREVFAVVHVVTAVEPCLSLPVRLPISIQHRAQRRDHHPIRQECNFMNHHSSCGRCSENLMLNAECTQRCGKCVGELKAGLVTNSTEYEAVT